MEGAQFRGHDQLDARIAEAYREFVKQTAGDKDTSPDQKATRHKLLESIGDYPEEIARAELEETQRQEVVQRALKYQAQGMSWKEAHERARLDVIEEAAVDPASPLKDKLDRFDGLLS